MRSSSSAHGSGPPLTLRKKWTGTGGLCRRLPLAAPLVKPARLGDEVSPLGAEQALERARPGGDARSPVPVFRVPVVRLAPAVVQEPEGDHDVGAEPLPQLRDPQPRPGDPAPVELPVHRLMGEHGPVARLREEPVPVRDRRAPAPNHAAPPRVRSKVRGSPASRNSFEGRPPPAGRRSAPGTSSTRRSSPTLRRKEEASSLTPRTTS